MDNYNPFSYFLCLGSNKNSVFGFSDKHMFFGIFLVAVDSFKIIINHGCIKFLHHTWSISLVCSFSFAWRFHILCRFSYWIDSFSIWVYQKLNFFDILRLKSIIKTLIHEQIWKHVVLRCWCWDIFENLIEWTYLLIDY